MTPEKQFEVLAKITGDFMALTLPTYVPGATKSLGEHELVRLADNLLRRWKRAGLVEHNGGLFMRSRWTVTPLGKNIAATYAGAEAKAVK